MGEAEVKELVAGLKSNIPDNACDDLLQLTPATYLGNAAEQARAVRVMVAAVYRGEA